MSSRKALFPLIVIMSYLFFTLGIYLFGPVSFARHNQDLVTSLLLLYFTSFCIGYVLAIYFNASKFRFLLDASEERRIPGWLLIFSFGYVSLSLYAYVPEFSFADYFYMLKYSVADPLAVYQKSLYYVKSSPSVHFLVVLFPLYFFVLVSFIYKFDRLSYVFKSLLIAVIALELSRWILMGRNKGIFDIFFVILTVLVIKRSRSDLFKGRDSSFLKVSKKKIYLGFLAALAFFVVLNYFSHSISARKVNFENYAGYSDNLLINIVPGFLEPLLVNLTDYLAQGYNALSYVFDMDWRPLYGLGHSPILMANVDGVSGSLFQDTYQYRMSRFDIDPYVNWHTAFVWIANDVHWFGVIFFMLAFGYYFCWVYLRSVIYRDRFAHCMLALLMISIFYLPANAQIFTQTGTTFAFWVFFSILAFYRLKEWVRGD
ncbi:hypothetical protein [Pseudomonas sp. PS02288]|uniref:hypothetical protein n=1 Tax=Pseudomonas sp. PS02288 TaxID=2991443 RepID=UPI00249A2724|nr:hypothetical protein [Pseudomonas sp. PS02288]